MEQEILIDNDALLKIVRYGLIDESLSLFDCSPNAVTTLVTAKYSLLPFKKRLRYCKNEESADRLEEFLSRCQPLNLTPANSEVLDRLNAAQSIDAGEASLLSVAALHQNILIITGDKRALAALCSDSSISDISRALTGRIISIEILFWLLLNNYPFEYIQQCVKSNPEVDKALTIAFGVTIDSDLETVRKALLSYIRHLRELTGELLYKQPST